MEMSGYVYVCSAGETFDSVAREVYGNEKYAAEILCANPECATKIVFAGDEKLYLPSIFVLPQDQAELPTTPPWKE